METRHEYHIFRGARIHCTVSGNGSAVVLLHGFLESVSMWKGVVPQLAKKRKVICIDLPGHGASDCLGYVHTMEDMAAAVEDVMKHERVRKADVIGHSMGGYVALALAELFPDNIRSLTLFQSTARDDSPEKKKDRLRAMELIKQNHKRFIRQSIPALFRPVNRKKFAQEIEELKNEAMQMPVQGILAALEGMRLRPNREILFSFPPYPVHIVASDKDPRVPLKEAEEQASISENVHLHVIKGCGHMAYLEKPAESLEILKKILV